MHRHPKHLELDMKNQTSDSGILLKNRKTLSKVAPRSGDLSDATPLPSLVTKWATSLKMNDLEMGSRGASEISLSPLVVTHVEQSLSVLELLMAAPQRDA
ncbi:hypothetical protein M569_00097 [Genlisea aurea]|uniref:Uncharacterized protein n=1 Tax=Genlisea aurea TaxID=192259 RepID=S8DAW8_9LAMI|nr:hypothetical protein M569_00097 [Genlisea aurea]